MYGSKIIGGGGGAPRATFAFYSVKLCTHKQFSRKTRKQIFFAEIKASYCPNIVSGLFSSGSTISTFSAGPHLCMSCDLNSCYYTNKIFQENQEELEANFFRRDKDLILFYCF